MTQQHEQTFISIRFYIKAIVLFGLLFSITNAAEAARLYLSPGTGVHQSNTTFTARVLVDTQGQSINAADATLSFNPRELSVVSVTRAGSIFNLWVDEPTYSNGAGTISFSGGLPSGYTGSTGNVMTVTFRAVGSGSARVNFGTGSVLANDGRGTNVLTSMSGGSYTIQSASTAPVPEVIEYVAPKNTPAAPKITSTTHGDPDTWSQNTTAKLEWSLPSDVIAVRTLLNESVSSVPTKVYDDPISSITLEDLEEGESYFHIQFKNEDGWGRVTSYRLAVDTSDPESFDISQGVDNDFTNPAQSLTLEVSDELTAVSRFLVKIDTDEAFEVVTKRATTSTTTSVIELPTLAPGYHTVIIEAFDEAGNSIIDSYSFTIEAFDKPRFTEFPSQINEEVIPLIKGETRPNSNITVTLQKIGSEPVVYTVQSLADGTFSFVPNGRLSSGVYELSVVATDSFGAVSESSEVVRIAVQQPGYVQVGATALNILSIIIPLLALILLGTFGLWYLFLYLRRFRSKVGKETAEALDILQREFGNLREVLKVSEAKLQKSRRTKKLTKAEAEMIETFKKALQTSEQAVEKEIIDVTEIK